MKRHTFTAPTPTHSASGLASTAAASVMALMMAGCASNSLAPSASSNGTSAPPVRQLQVCHVEPVKMFIGHNTVASTLENIRQKSGSYMVRVLRENQPATTDFNQERLNVITNAEGKITALRCG
ncbi:hypothetical protein KUF54_16650 [Comamonas sp. Y33R10-2]|uniref:I78 family peptidase inhibitor n=1 Tax=Comamonas sp. Y33R10-2 TaxID=2853257 RepID=UPI001C5CA90B|nr:I78 family peptidase inhibitor [Comamonas sp. Y33R10-2]QXZ09605.1 hypothetical protein KUF54_16650 [Comamonas sp. Y33R10-2]